VYVLFFVFFYEKTLKITILSFYTEISGPVTNSNILHHMLYTDFLKMLFFKLITDFFALLIL
jgi:hypothetical protein